MKIVQTSKQDI